MWNRIFQTWRDNMGAYDEARTTNGLGCRWGKILAAKREALRMYEDLTTGKPFKYEHCNNADVVVRPQGRKGTKKKKRRLNDEKSVVDALYNLQSTLEK
ncbi:hypothetical protein EZV62_023672 [Acer yangbiense]|uniref:Uncharacterized protein n=1 Tax=Acer yangbiense TaxID=1000413 RepID=A0A5C7H2C5_9ROSI|nr:hypothetical protein EZV62_023672 [Acer yangbiense]